MKVKECNKCQRGSAQSTDSAQSATDSGNKNGMDVIYEMSK